MSEIMLSLYDYLGKPAGPALGKQVAKQASWENVEIDVRFIETSSYQGEVLLYPQSFLSKYFKKISEKETLLSKTSSIVELYCAIQAEGSRAGKPTVIVRTTGCTHRCFFKNGGWCDAWQTSVHPEKGQYSLNDVFRMYDIRPDIKEMMLTGGSPTMHPELVNILSTFCYDNNIFLTIETEGSHFVKTDYPIDLISLSPKFDNSIPVLGEKTPLGKIVDENMIKQHNKFRLNIDAIRQSIEYHSDYQFKPVVNPIEMPEVWEQIVDFANQLDIPKDKTWIMPPGDNREELIRVYPMVIDFCVANGYNFTGREHIIAFDKKRRV